MYDIILTAWVLKEITADTVNAAVAKGVITQDQANTILATPQYV